MNEHALNVKFVGEVEKHQVLYNYTLPGYSRKDVTEKAWSEVGKVVQMTVAECKARWKNLRAVFVRHLKPSPNGPSSRKKKPYYLTEAMHFTLPYIKAVNTTNLPTPVPQVTTNELVLKVEPNDDGESESTASSLSPAPPSPPKHAVLHKDDFPEWSTSRPNFKRAFTVETIDDAFNEYLQARKAKMVVTHGQNPPSTNSRSEALRMFVLSLLPDLELMNCEQIRQFKRKTLHVVEEILSPQTFTTSTSLPSTYGMASHSSPLQFAIIPQLDTPRQSTDEPQPGIAHYSSTVGGV